MKQFVPLLALLLLLTGCAACGPAAPVETAGAAGAPEPQSSHSSTPLPVPPEETAAPIPTPEPSRPGWVEPEPVPTQAPEDTPLPPPEEEQGPTDEAVLAAYERAEEAYGWFEQAPMALNREEQRTVGERLYCRVDYPGIGTLADLRGYLKSLFSDGLVERLLPADGTQYVELDGVLYAVDGGRGADITKGAETVQVLRDGPSGRYTVRVTVEVLNPEEDFAVVGSETHDFLYEQVGEKWIFTTFSLVR